MPDLLLLRRGIEGEVLKAAWKKESTRGRRNGSSIVTRSLAQKLNLKLTHMRRGWDYVDQITLARPKKIERQFEMHPG